MSPPYGGRGCDGNGKAIILVVDRDPQVRELEAHFLHEAGFSVVQFLGGQGIKVGEGVTLARHRCAAPAVLRQWLQAACQESGNWHGTSP